MEVWCSPATENSLGITSVKRRLRANGRGLSHTPAQLGTLPNEGTHFFTLIFFNLNVAMYLMYQCSFGRSAFAARLAADAARRENTKPLQRASET